MIGGIKGMIARCIERMRGGACATCENRAYCPAGHWQQAFGPPSTRREGSSSFFALLGRLAEATQSAMPGTRPRFEREVRRAVQALLPSADASVDRVAHELGLSRQTLYRRLKAEGTTFEELLERVRRELALRYIERDRLPVKAAAYRLGFSDPAAFSRAFKRWTGSSPSDFRAAGAG